VCIPGVRVHALGPTLATLKMFGAAVFSLLRRFRLSQELLCIMDAKKDINFCKDFALSSLRAY